MPRGIPKSGHRRIRVYQWLRRYRNVVIFFIRKYNISCYFCGQRFTKDDLPRKKVDEITIHHIDGNSRNNKKENLAPAHRKCHKRFHILEAKRGSGKIKHISQFLCSRCVHCQYGTCIASWKRKMPRYECKEFCEITKND